MAARLMPAVMTLTYPLLSSLSMLSFHVCIARSHPLTSTVNKCYNNCSERQPK